MTYVVFAGNIGAGKTTLARAFAAADDRRSLQEESVENNPFLELSYRDKAKWTFHLNTFFLTDRARQLSEFVTSNSVGVFDRSIYEDLIFLNYSIAHDLVSKEEFETLSMLADVLASLIPPPTLMVYVRPPVGEVLRRVEARSRAYESGIDHAYLAELQEMYDEWIGTFNLCPVLQLDNAEDQIAQTVLAVNEALATHSARSTERS